MGGIVCDEDSTRLHANASVFMAVDSPDQKPIQHGKKRGTRMSTENAWPSPRAPDRTPAFCWTLQLCAALPKIGIPKGALGHDSAKLCLPAHLGKHPFEVAAIHLMLPSSQLNHPSGNLDPVLAEGITWDTGAGTS
eukprot:3383097-Rhodomonas_salina.1